MKKLIVLVCLTLLPAATAQADVIHLGTWTPGGVVNIHLGASSINVLVGAVPATVGAQAFDTYCVSDLNINPPGTLPGNFFYPGKQSMATDWAAHQPIPSTNLQGERAAYLYNTFATSAGVDRSALQLAIWNGVFDTDFSVSAGNFLATSGPIATANTYLASLAAAQAAPGFFADATWYRLYYPASTGPNGTEVQGFIGADPVPEPASMLLLGTGLFGVVGAMRRRFAKK